MVRWFAFQALIALLLSSCAIMPVAQPGQLRQAPAGESTTSTLSATCAVTPTVQDQPPDDPNADPFGFGNWQINADRTIWVDIPPGGAWQTGGEKVIWIRPVGTQLTISGQRLDAAAPPLRVDAPCCYPTGFEVNGLYFPAAGCWEVTATAGDHELRFTIEVRAGEAMAQEPPGRGVPASSALAKSVLQEFCNSASCALRVIDGETGATMAEYEPIALGHYAALGASPDLRQLAMIAYRNNTYLRDGKLSFVDLSNWEVVTTTLTFDGAYNTPSFSPDNSHLLVVTQPETVAGQEGVYLVDVSSGALLAEQTLNFSPSNTQFSSDGSRIMFFGVNGVSDSYAALLDAATLAIIWQAKIEGLTNGVVMPAASSDPMEGVWWQPAAVFDRDQARLYLVHADQEALTTVDFNSQSMTTQAISKPVSWIERLLMLTARTAYAKMANGVSKTATLSADGSQLYVVGSHYHMEAGAEYVQEGLGLQVIDLASGEERAHINTQAQALMLDPEGGRLYLSGWANDEGQPYTNEWTEIYDAKTLELIQTLEDRSVAVAHRLDGAPILLTTTTLDNGQTELAILDPQSLAVMSSAADWYGGYIGWVVMP